MTETPTDTRCGFVALIGVPNAGKSTLINALVGTKVSIVTHKVQTTRALVRGIAISGPSQVIFVDTPGIFAPRRRLDEAMVTTAWTGVSDADMLGLLVDARRGLEPDVEKLIERLKDVRAPVALILTKIDTMKRDRLLGLAEECNKILPFAATFMVSGLTGSGVEDVLKWFGERMRPGPWLYPEDQISDMPIRALAAEITREKLFLRLHDELPYELTVETDQWKPMRNGSVRVEQTIFVARESQKVIVLGAKGQTIKQISMAARQEITELAEQPVHLFLFVKVRENWSDDPERYRKMGLELPK